MVLVLGLQQRARTHARTHTHIHISIFSVTATILSSDDIQCNYNQCDDAQKPRTMLHSKIMNLFKMWTIYRCMWSNNRNRPTNICLVFSLSWLLNSPLLSLALSFVASVSVGIDLIWIYIWKRNPIKSRAQNGVRLDLKCILKYCIWICSFWVEVSVWLYICCWPIFLFLSLYLYLCHPHPSAFSLFSVLFFSIPLSFTIILSYTYTTRIHPLCSLWIITQTSVLDNPKMFEIMLIYNWILNFELNIQFILLYIKQINTHCLYSLCIPRVVSVYILFACTTFIIFDIYLCYCCCCCCCPKFSINCFGIYVLQRKHKLIIFLPMCVCLGSHSRLFHGNYLSILSIWFFRCFDLNPISDVVVLFCCIFVVVLLKNCTIIKICKNIGVIWL